MIQTFKPHGGIYIIKPVPIITFYILGLPIILLRISQNFHLLFFCAQPTEDTLALEIQASKHYKVMNLNPWCWLQTVNKM